MTIEGLGVYEAGLRCSIGFEASGLTLQSIILEKPQEACHTCSLNYPKLKSGLNPRPNI